MYKLLVGIQKKAVYEFNKEEFKLGLFELERDYAYCGCKFLRIGRLKITLDKDGCYEARRGG